MAYFISPSHQSVCVSSNVAKQRLGKNVTAAMNTYAKIEKLWTRRFLCGSCRIKEGRRLLFPEPPAHV
jgi:hypothetical protein